MKKAILPLAVLIAVVSQIGGSAQSPDALTYSRGFLLTGNYVVSSVDLPRGGGTGVLTFTTAKGNAVPVDAEIAAAYLYWEALAPAGAPIAVAKFRGVDIATAKASRLTQLPLSGQSNCWGSSGNNPRVLTMFRADVLSMLPKQYDANDKWTGRYVINNVQHSIALGTKGAGNNLMTVAGATLLLVYRHPSEPLRKVVIYDGVHAQRLGDTTTQTIGGFYRSSLTKSARLTHIGGSGAKNAGERLLFNGSPLPISNPFPNPIDSGSDRGWSSPTVDVSSRMPGSISSNGFGEYVTTSVDHGATNQNSTPYECMTWAAIVFSTAVADTDADGLPDALEAENSGLKDPPTPQYPAGQLLPDLYGMGARVGQRDLFVEVNAMIANPGTTYGSPSAPFSNTLTSVTDPNGHNHMPPPNVLKMVGDAYLAGGVNVHFDVGDLEQYQSISPAYDCLDAAPGSECDAMPYLVPSHLARGGEAILERASPTGQFAAYPGTIGWPFGVQLHRDAPVGDDGEELTNQQIRDEWIDGTRRRRFDRIRSDYFHYALYGHARGKAKSTLPCLDENGEPSEYDNGTSCNVANPQFNVPSSVSGIADLPGGNVLITLGLWDNVAFVASPFIQASTTLHELGHNGNLWHGGGPARFGDKALGTVTVAEANCKPNYLSVMSYLFQVHGLFGETGGPQLDYSDRLHNRLLENALQDALAPAPKYRPAWFAPLGSQLAVEQGATAARRFCNGTKFEDAPPATPSARLRASTIQGLIDWDGNPATNTASDIDFNGSAADVHAGFNDWANLRLDQIRGTRQARLFSTANGDLIDFGSGDLIDFGSGDLIDFGSGDLIDFGSGTHLVHLGSGDFFKYGSGDLIDFGSGDLIDFGSGVFMAASEDVGYNGGDLIDFGSGDLIDFGSGDLIDFGSGDLIDFGSGDLIDFGSGDLIDFGSGDELDFGDGNGLQELDYEYALDLGAPVPYGLAACIIGVNCVEAQPTDPLHRVRFSWTAPTFGNTAGYDIYRSTPTSAAALVGSSEGLLFIDQDELADGEFYTYTVRARFDDGSISPHSDPITIQAINGAPVAGDDSYRVAPNTALDVAAPGVLANDADQDSGASTLVVSTPGTMATSFGTVTLNADGSFVYTPNPNFLGIDSFTYRAQNIAADGTPLSGLSNVATVTIVVR